MTDLLASATDDRTTSAGPGLAGFLVLAGLVLAIVVLYRSMRKQFKRIDFDPDGLTDDERMRGHDTSGAGDGIAQDVREADMADPPDNANGHRQP